MPCGTPTLGGTFIAYDPAFDFTAREVFAARAASWSENGPLVLRYAETQDLLRDRQPAGQVDVAEVAYMLKVWSGRPASNLERIDGFRLICSGKEGRSRNRHCERSTNP